MDLRYRQSEPHPDSDAAHLGPSPHSCVGIIRGRISCEHVAEGPAVGDGNADADGIAIRVNHRRQVAGGVLPVCHSFFGNSFGVCNGEHRQVGGGTRTLLQSHIPLGYYGGCTGRRSIPVPHP